MKISSIFATYRLIGKHLKLLILNSLHAPFMPVICANAEPEGVQP
jgi:hypothetical protein